MSLPTGVACLTPLPHSPEGPVTGMADVFPSVLRGAAWALSGVASQNRTYTEAAKGT